MDQHSSTHSPSPPSVSLFIRGCGDPLPTDRMANVVLELLCPAKAPLWISLPFTQEEGTRGADRGTHWEFTWQLVKNWPGAKFLSDEQWVLLASLCRTLHWFATDKNDATTAAWPSFIRSYALLGQVGRHFRKHVTVNGTVLLHLLVTWAQEHVPNAFIIPQPAFDLPVDVQIRVEGKGM